MAAFRRKSSYEKQQEKIKKELDKISSGKPHLLNDSLKENKAKEKKTKKKYSK